MIDPAAALVGLGLGFTHATEPDHVAAVTTLIRRETGAVQAARVAMFWGLGHAGSFLSVGLCIVVIGLRVPASFERAADILVASMLVALGVRHLSNGAALAHPHSANRRQPIAIGLLHGLAGSATVALLAATTIQSRLWASVYLALFGAGTMLGMAVLTFVLAWPITWAERNKGRVSRWVLRAPGLLSVGLGLVIGVEALVPGVV